MVQSAFETYDEYTDSVFYDASAWSIANFYNMPYAGVNTNVGKGEQLRFENNKADNLELSKATYAYLISWDDYYAPKALYQLQKNNIVVSSAFKPFKIKVGNEEKEFSYGTLMIPLQLQNKIC